VITDTFPGRTALSLNLRIWRTVGIGLLCAVTLLIYFPGLYGDFEFDDMSNIVNNEALEIDSLTPANIFQASMAGGTAGPLKRPISMATLVVNRYLTGLDPFYMKLTNVVIHILNGISLFFLTWLLLRAHYAKQHQQVAKETIFWLAFAISALWTIHPLALTSTLYIVQRMTSISAFFTIWGLISYVIARQRMQSTGSGIALLLTSFVTFLALGAFSKENGLLLPIFTLVIEVTFFRFQTHSKTHRVFIVGFYTIVLALPFLVASIWLLFNSNWLLSGYHMRPFNLTERLMTEARVIWFYLRLIVVPDISQMGIYHDDIPLSHGPFSPWTTLPAIVGLVTLGIGAWLLRHRLPVFSFGVLFFLAGHSMESTIIPLEITHEHRNYLPMFSIIFAAVFYLLDGQRNPSSLKSRYVFISFFILLSATATYVRAGYWGSLGEHSLMEARNHPGSGRALYQAGRMNWKLALAVPEKREYFFQAAREDFEKAAIAVDYQNEATFALIHLSFYAKFEMKQEWFDKLLTKIHYKPFPASTANMIYNFTQCELEGTCKLPPQDMQKIYDAALKNPTLVGRSRAAVLSTAALYTANQGNFQSSVDYLYQAVKSAGSDLFYRITLIDLLIKLGQFDEARKQLTIIKQKDRFSAFSLRIEQKEKMLTEWEKSAKGAQKDQ
jgi:hypothetical protein